MTLDATNLGFLSYALANARLNKFTNLLRGVTRVMDFRFQDAIGYTQLLSHRSATS